MDERFLSDRNTKRIQSKFKIPVDSFNPGTHWIVSLDRESHLPTDLELRQIRSYGEFVTKTTYLHEMAERILALPLPKAGEHHTVIFRKGHGSAPGTEEHWFRRKAMWRNPRYIPNPVLPQYRGLSLVHVMDAEETLFPEKWALWKRKYPKLFPAT
ncbi:MAG: hypothetical protein A3D67_00460 [Candidatus Lloydbacteria bacterium RIFCSPHIGHO2_02_FULL_51_22]|uniref:Uncharacterized protein n=2 Tax=Candidatus Lloydiibacteriota TaxID=1817910 RepID=A0A1G2DFC0_9BACT|nr:MAG: hypothetical protein A3D67_00460 [Candidatus Lloydbacteria bacterium RIFCSPHIGHO2_02_FULL_51_22]OGZ14876.1 MAG: hypothetical protein A3J08_03250 [Candidatus Lloydbacteria bacterium RIFCSPLOWO2_02_FULL_51_11]